MEEEDDDGAKKKVWIGDNGADDSKHEDLSRGDLHKKSHHHVSPYQQCN